MGPDNALAFQLADEGYAVWLGNARGNTYSRNHTTRSTEHPYFWRFSWHEIGYFDIPAMIDYALKTNEQGHKSIHYIGHSQGTTVFYTLMSTRPEYNDKIRTAQMLAPVAFMNNMVNPLVRALGPYLGYQNTYSLLFESQEFLPYNDFVLALAYNACGQDSRFSSYCSILYDSSPDGRSNTEQQSGHFRYYDYGKKKNMKVYDLKIPPDYPTNLITSKTHLWYGDNDIMAAVVDVLRLSDTLPNMELHHMEDPEWNHGDFVTNWEVRKYINDPIINLIKEMDAQN
ncbi:GH22311 [Drosophila grimshawi]|uniref:GH22311 n=1 Tax=Drosophila grimshawi TaxID=7222 RepID=B4JYX8_DROGR|nr:GH22311 [Drosophila grimshawi]